jgi:hypothetical protein
MSLSLSAYVSLLMERTELSIPASQFSTFSQHDFRDRFFTLFLFLSLSLVSKVRNSKSSSYFANVFLSCCLFPWKRTEFLFRFHFVFRCVDMWWNLLVFVLRLAIVVWLCAWSFALCFCVRVMDLFTVFGNSCLRVCVIHLRIFCKYFVLRFVLLVYC